MRRHDNCIKMFETYSDQGEKNSCIESLWVDGQRLWDTDAGHRIFPERCLTDLDF